MIKAATERIDITTRKTEANDNLYAKVLVLQASDTTVALVSIDYISLGGEICSVGDEFFPNLRRSLSQKGVSQLICGTTHTHTPGTMVTGEEEILQKIEECVDRLLNNLQEVNVSYSKGSDASFIINRNLPTSIGDWTVRQAHALPPESSYDRLNYADDSLRALKFYTCGGETLCTVFNFGCHPLLGFANDKPTANFPGIAEKLIEEKVGGVAMMFQSTGGDVCEVDYKNFFKAKNCTQNGISLGFSVLNALKNGEETEPQIRTASIETDFPLRNDYELEMQKIQNRQLEICNRMQGSPLDFKSFLPLYMKYLISPEYPLDHKYVYLHEEECGVTQLRDQDVINRRNIEKYLANIQSMEELTKLGSEYVTLKWHKERVEKLGNKARVEITAIKIGDVILLSAPFEPLTEIGVRLRQKFGEKLFLASYSNGYLHYGAAEDKYPTGAYEIRECDLSPEWCENYFEAAEKLIKELA